MRLATFITAVIATLGVAATHVEAKGGSRSGGAKSAMLKVLLVSFALAMSSSSAWAHGGGIDKCGGHKDKKRGGYHVHQVAKYCGCFPTATECKAKAPVKSTKK